MVRDHLELRRLAPEQNFAISGGARAAVRLAARRCNNWRAAASGRFQKRPSCSPSPVFSDGNKSNVRLAPTRDRVNFWLRASRRNARMVSNPSWSGLRMSVIIKSISSGLVLAEPFATAGSLRRHSQRSRSAGAYRAPAHHRLMRSMRIMLTLRGARCTSTYRSSKSRSCIIYTRLSSRRRSGRKG